MNLQGLVPKKKISRVDEIPVFKSSTYPLTAGDERTLNFLNTLSKRIAKEPTLRKDPAYAALSFWLRKASISRILKENNVEQLSSLYSLRPVGVVFHLCPSNVDTMFFYSLTLSLLGGNKNIIRVSSRLEDSSVFLLFDLINAVSKEKDFELFSEYINIISYERNDEINELFSSLADARVIWGGDKTIEQFKQYKTKYRVKDLYFTDRTSLSLIKVETFITDEEAHVDLCKRLYTDIYTFDQMGCSSPHCIFLVGTEENNAQYLKKLYTTISRMAEEVYERDISSMASFKLNKSVEDILGGISQSVLHENNYFVMADLKTEDIPHSCGMGYTYYKSLNQQEELLSFINEKVQTLGTAGFSKEEMKDLVAKCPPNAVDRVVPIGKALEFDYIWDGYNIFLELLNFKSVK